MRHNHESRDDQAKRIFRRTYCVSFALLVLLSSVAIPLALRATESATGWKLTGSPGDGSSGLTGGLFVLWMMLAAFPAAWRLRRAGLSREARVVEFFPNAGHLAQQFLREAPFKAPFEVRSQPSKAKRASSYAATAALMAALCGLAWWAPRWPDASPIIKVLAPGGMLMFGGLGAVYLYALALDPPDFRADAQRVSGCNGLWFCSARWERVASMEIVTIHNVMGELAQIQPRFKDARGKTIFFLSLGSLHGSSPQARERIVAFLRECCAQPVASEIQ